MVVNLVLGYVVPFILLIIAGYLVKTFHDDNVIKWIKVAVKAAEQIYTKSGMGREKFAYVEDWISAKFKIPKEDLRNLIESAVYELNIEQGK